MIFKGYIDESYGSDRNIFALSCIVATGKQWSEIERKWKLHLAGKNKILAKAGRATITRYHASDCSGRHGEYEGWSHAERDAFVKGLFLIFKQVPTFTWVFDVQLKELCECFPEYAEDPLNAAYFWLTKFLMLSISRDFRNFNRSNRMLKITLFHDRTAGNCDYDATILRSFNSLINDPTFVGREMFSTIGPLSWKDCIPLQPADLLAFEGFKQAEAKLAERESRKSFKALLNMDNFGIHSKTLNKSANSRLREMIEAAAKNKHPE